MGHAIVAGGARASVPVTGIKASDLAVGSSVFLMENGVAAEYLVVNQGIPSGSSLYDASCDGTWLLRKGIYEKRAWHSSNVNDYENSTIHRYLNSTFFNLFGTVEQNAIKQVKIPYRAGSGYSTTVTSGSSGLPTKIFLLSGKEINFNFSSMPTEEGDTLSYFVGCVESGPDSKRVAYFSGSETIWWLRSPFCNSTYGPRYAMCGNTNGNWFGNYCYTSYGIRPALVLPSNALFDTNTLILKGVA